MDPHNIWDHIRGYPMLFTVVPPSGTNLARAKRLTILGRTHSLPSYLPISSKHGRLLIKVIPLFANTKKEQPKMLKQSYIYKNEQRIAENAKTKLCLQKRRKYSQTRAIFKKTKKEQLKMAKQSYNKTKQHKLTVE